MPRTQNTNEVHKHLKDVLKQAKFFQTNGQVGHRQDYKELAMQVYDHNLLHMIQPDILEWLCNRGHIPTPQPLSFDNAASLMLDGQQTPQSPSPGPSHPPQHQPAQNQPLDPLPTQPLPPNLIIDQHVYALQSGSLEPWDPQPSTFPVSRLEVDTLKARRIQCNSLACFSDSRCKEEVRTLSPQETGAILSRIQAKKFKYKMEFGGGGKDVYGFIAQELREVCPDLVEESESGLLTIRSLEIIPLLVDAVNQLNSKYQSDSLAGISLNSTGPTLLASYEGDKLVVNNHALEVLKGIKGPVAVLGMSGSARSGNSSLCNRLLQQGEEGHFQAGNIDFSTKVMLSLGVWMSAPAKQEDESYRIVLDSQGYDIDNGTQLLCFLCLLSSTLVVGTKLELSNTLFEHIGVVAKEKEALKGIKNCNLPELVILIRDAQLEHRTLAGRKDTPNEWLKDFQCSTLMELPHPEDTEFNDGLSHLRDTIARSCVSKRLEGMEMDGAALAQLVRTGAEALNAMRARVLKLEKRMQCEQQVELMWEYDHQVDSTSEDAMEESLQWLSPKEQKLRRFYYSYRKFRFGSQNIIGQHCFD